MDVRLPSKEQIPIREEEEFAYLLSAASWRLEAYILREIGRSGKAPLNASQIIKLPGNVHFEISFTTYLEF